MSSLPQAYGEMQVRMLPSIVLLHGVACGPAELPAYIMIQPELVLPLASPPPPPTELPKQASPTAKKLHRRLSPGAALKAALSAPSRQGRRAHLAAAAAAALLLLILWTGQKAASSPLLPPAGLSGTIKQQQQQQQQLQQQQKEAEEARQWLAQAALLSEVEQARQPVPGPVLVEFTAPGLLVPLK
jgi:hypothetical protein